MSCVVYFLAISVLQFKYAFHKIENVLRNYSYDSSNLALAILGLDINVMLQLDVFAKISITQWW